jgi:serine/threonine protein kinase
MSQLTHALEKTIVVVAAAGDASRVFASSARSEIPATGKAPLWIAERALPITSMMEGLCFLDIMLGATEQILGVDAPLAIITGPNTHEAITGFLQNSYYGGLRNAAVLQQVSYPVVTMDGNIVYWEDGRVLKAPDGTAGCLDVLLRSEIYKAWRKAGYEYVFLWYGNDVGPGTHLPELMNNFLGKKQLLFWLSTTNGIALANEIGPETPVSRLTELCIKLEDAPAAYIISCEGLESFVKLADWHKTLKKAPVKLRNGELLDVYKRERFLSDAVWKVKTLQELPNRTTGQPAKKSLWESAKAAFSTKKADVAKEQSRGSQDSRPAQVRQQLLDRLGDKNKVIEALKSGNTTMNFQSDIGEKRPGEFLIEDYRVIETIKTGGMGIVYVCQDQDSDKHTVIKTYKDEIRWNKPTFVRRFWFEANSWVTLLPHPNVVRAHQVREIDGRLHIFMEYVPGGSLRDRLSTQRLKTEECLRIGLDICSGVQSIHGQGLIHRDIKPENILLTEDGTGKITDFGLVAALDDPKLKEPIGTRYYMPPEQIQAPEEVTTAADVYALCVTLYEMFTGYRPFQGAGKEEILEKQLKSPPGNLSEVNREVSRALGNVILKCLDPLPEKRASLRELQRKLKDEYFRRTKLNYQEPAAEETFINGMMLRANSFTALNKISEALDIYNQILKDNPFHQSALVNLASTHFTSGDYGKCIQVCLDLVCMPNCSTDIRDAAEEMIQMSMVMMGVPLADISPEFTHSTLSEAENFAWKSMLVAMRDGDMKSALRYADVAIKIDPRSSSAWTQRAACLYNQGLYSESMEALNMALETASQPEQKKVIEALIRRCQMLLRN